MLILVQIVILSCQFFIFYPCFLSADTLGNGPKNVQSRSKRAIEAPPPRSSVAQGVAPLAPNEQAQNIKLKYEPVWESLEKRPIPSWYEDAKFGIFIHWGVYSVPSYVGVGTNGLAEWFWYYQTSGTAGGAFHTQAALESVKNFMHENYPPDFKYQDFAQYFTAEFYDPVHWAEILRKSGARYVVLTSKHHDGFTMWPSKKSWNWNVMDNGPHRDLVGDLEKAVRTNTDLKFGLYHSLYEWFNPMYLDDKANMFKTQTYVKEKLGPELREIVEKYKPEIVWSDGQWEAPCEYFNCTQFLAWLYNDSPVKDTVVTNDRWGSDTTCKHGGYLTCEDRFNPGKKQERKWENCMTVDRESWGYRRNAVLKDYYSMENLVKTLAETVSFGGNLLMNIGPTAHGTIPPILEERLLQMGDWLRVNGEAIYGTHTWHTQTEGSNLVYYTAKTGKDLAGDVIVYAIIVQWPDNDVLELTTPVAGNHTTISWLGYNGGNLLWQRKTGGGLLITLPKVSLKSIPSQWAWSFKMKGLDNADLKN